MRGELRVRVLNAEGAVLPGFDWTECEPVHGDAVAHRITWRGCSCLPTTQPICLDFVLDSTDIYGFDVTDSAPIGGIAVR